MDLNWPPIGPKNLKTKPWGYVCIPRRLVTPSGLPGLDPKDVEKKFNSMKK